MLYLPHTASLFFILLPPPSLEGPRRWNKGTFWGETKNEISVSCFGVFNFVLHSFCPAVKQVHLLVLILISHNLSPHSTKRALVLSLTFLFESLPSCYERIEYESRYLCVCVSMCYCMTTSQSLTVEHDTASITHPRHRESRVAAGCLSPTQVSTLSCGTSHCLKRLSRWKLICCVVCLWKNESEREPDSFTLHTRPVNCVTSTWCYIL